jgi:hypothetical protein
MLGSEQPLDLWFHGVTVSTRDFESRDPSSNLGETSGHYFVLTKRIIFYPLTRKIQNTYKKKQQFDVKNITVTVCYSYVFYVTQKPALTEETKEKRKRRNIILCVV